MFFRELPRVFAKYPVEERRFSTSNCAVNGRARSLFPSARATASTREYFVAISSGAEDSLTDKQIISAARGAGCQAWVAEEDAMKSAGDAARERVLER